MASANPLDNLITKSVADEQFDVAWIRELAEKKREVNASHSPEGQLAVDVLESGDELIIMAPMAGTNAEEIELHLQNDSLTIRGERTAPADLSGATFYNEECYWGRFSRTIILPVEVRSDGARSEYKNGILTIRLPKLHPQHTIPIIVVEE